MWQISGVSRFLRVGGLLCVGLFLLADTVVAQPPAVPAQSRGGGFGGFGRSGGEPSLSFELRREAFAAKMKITEKQQEQLNEISMRRAEFFRSLAGGGLRGQPPSEETLAKMKEFETATTNVLDDGQKALWEARKAEIKAEQAAREASRQTNRRDGQAQVPAVSDRDRIVTLEEEVKALKAEVAKLKAAIVITPASKP